MRVSEKLAYTSDLDISAAGQHTEAMSDSAPETVANDATADLSGRDLGDFQLLRRLGRGAMAEVYLAQQQSLDRQVAIKVLKRELANDQSYVRRFHNEARAAAALVHANIVQIYEVGASDGIHFIAQEYVPGRNLGQLIERNGPPELPLAVAVIRQVAAALAKAAEQGIVHRDIKPENIMLSPQGEVKVADFGLARVQGGDTLNLTQVGMTMGTPLYMSPEQIEGKPLDPRSDIYSFGVTCYHMLAGDVPFTADSPLGVAVQHLNSAPPRLEDRRPDLPQGVCRIVHKMIEKPADRRYASAREILQDLRALQIEGLDDRWSEGLEEWTSAEIIALSDARIEATQKLDALMKTSALLTPRKPRYGWWALAAAACLLLGAALTALFRSDPILAGAAAPAVPRRDTVWQQLYQAKMIETEAGWRSVEEYFRPAESRDHQYAANLARAGLVRHYIWEAGGVDAYEKAFAVAEQLAALGPNDEQFRVFGQAASAIALNLLGRQEEANQQFALLTPPAIPMLDARTRRLLSELMRKNQSATSKAAQTRIEELTAGLADPADPTANPTGG